MGTTTRSRSEAAAWVAVAAGGAVGASARFGTDIAAAGLNWPIPSATLTVNVLGCLLMGVLVALVLAHPGRHPLWRPFLGVGLLGGFTTFSAFAGDAVLMSAEGDWAMSSAYVIATLAGGLMALWLGYAGGARLRHVFAPRGSVGPPRLGEPA